MDDGSLLDCLIIGAGPAGLTAGINLNRFLRNVRIIDAGHSRALLIPRTHNYPGFTDGISGNDLLEKLRDQLYANGGSVTSGKVMDLQRTRDGTFLAETQEETIRAKTVLLATGMIDIEPELEGFQAVKEKGLIRYCPICDGFEFTDERIGIIARDERGVGEAIFIKQFSANLTMIDIADGAYLDPPSMDRLASEKIDLLQGHVQCIFTDEQEGVRIRMEEGAEHVFDILYCALGTRVRSELGMDLGALRNPGDYLVVNPHMQTGIEGLYAAGDMTNHLSQITVATGQAAIAATAIHNRLNR